DNSLDDLTPECEEKIIALYKDLAQKYPKSNAIKLFPLLYTTGRSVSDNFKMFADEYIQAALRKGVPSLFVNLKKLYSDPQKEAIIERLVEGYLECLKNNGTFTQSKNDDDVKEPPTAYLWTLYLFSQHYDNKRDTTKALTLIDEAIEHTPTLVELYMTKGRILKHGGNLDEAMKVMNEARELDLQDRFINSKCSKYMLRNDQTEEAEQKIGLFTRGDAPDPLTDLADMQCMWFVLEEGESYIRQKKWGKALKRFHQIEKHFADITDDQFDFHTYCLRKVTLRAYLSMLRLEDQLRSHPYYFRAAQSAIKIYIELYDNPNTVTISEENEDYEHKNPPAKPHEPLPIEELSKYHDLDTFDEQLYLKSQQPCLNTAPTSHSNENLVSEQDEDEDSNLQIGNEGFNLSSTIMNGLRALKFERPTPIQEKTLHAGLNGRDVIGKAETGSGKTLAFGIPILEYTIKQKKKKFEKQLAALILTPTRELAIQIKNHLQSVGKFATINIMTVVGGMAIQKQKRLLEKNPSIIVGTPGRLWELLSERHDKL
ncbi:12386_t:CDS:10, partial [Dentiscutata heterogama]